MDTCEHTQWRWLDCDECDTCEIRVCVACGADIDEDEYEFVTKGGIHWVQPRGKEA